MVVIPLSWFVSCLIVLDIGYSPVSARSTVAVWKRVSEVALIRSGLFLQAWLGVSSVVCAQPADCRSSPPDITYNHGSKTGRRSSFVRHAANDDYSRYVVHADVGMPETKRRPYLATSVTTTDPTRRGAASAVIAVRMRKMDEEIARAAEERGVWVNKSDGPDDRRETK